MDRKSEGKGKDNAPSEAFIARVYADLKTCKDFEEEHEQLFGGIDEMMLIRYGKGTSPPEERALVEQAARDYPAIRVSLEIDKLIAAAEKNPELMNDDQLRAEIAKLLDEPLDPISRDPPHDQQAGKRRWACRKDRHASDPATKPSRDL